MDPTGIIIVVILIVLIILILLIVFATLGAINKEYKNFVKENSLAILNLKKLNINLKLQNVNEYYFQKDFDNENMFKELSCEDYLIYELQYYKYKILNDIKIYNNNKTKMDEYKIKVESIKHFGNYLKPIGKLKRDKLLKCEKVEFNKLIRNCSEFCVDVRLILTNIKGYELYEINNTFYEKDCKSLINRLNNKNNNFYNDKEIWNAICRVERAKVSNKMRFAIYERDHNRCRKCGSRYNLEIDNIIPISKGGKSTMDNLQTLCHNCNVEKGNKMEH